MKWIIQESHHNMMIRDYLKKVHSFSKRLIISLKFDGGSITVNGEQKTVRYYLQTEDVLSIKFSPEKIGENLRADDLPLHIIYEDDAILILDKPVGIAVVPSAQNKTGTIANRVLAYYKKHDIPYTIHIVTRLDRDTSGLLLIAKHSYSHSLLAIEQQAGRVSRKYKAIVNGNLEKKQGIINAPIKRKKDSIIERTVDESGKIAITEYEVIKEEIDYSLVNVTLKTGRTHQIRVHFSYIGHPLVGDDLYGGSREVIDRQALHCYELSFRHPYTKKEVSYHLPLPNDMRQLFL